MEPRKSTPQTNFTLNPYPCIEVRANCLDWIIDCMDETITPEELTDKVIEFMCLTRDIDNHYYGCFEYNGTFWKTYREYAINEYLQSGSTDSFYDWLNQHCERVINIEIDLDVLYNTTSFLN